MVETSLLGNRVTTVVLHQMRNTLQVAKGDINKGDDNLVYI